MRTQAKTTVRLKGKDAVRFVRMVRRPTTNRICTETASLGASLVKKFNLA